MNQSGVPEIPASPAPHDIAELLARETLPTGELNWWLAVFATCNGGLLAIEQGDESARDWAEVYLDALDKARQTGGIGLPETLWRKILVVQMMVHYDGASAGDRVRDPERVFAEFLEDVGVSRESVLAEYREVMATAKNGGLAKLRADPALLRRIEWLTGVRRAAGGLCGIAGHISDPDMREQARLWCAASAALA
ncbi:hypothetical protein [Actinomadura sp. HBU206391]|uniref:hypothetical protein n=1 Tax=Actinomadura sp. HBU206391 TaxID=2731692 RepID=UPI00164FC3D9|nr:hypothetical protein [Actinomadura sp. HBU206391]MBC6459519.1 hypothetical protein [Actinomadura sp. HBU206391]